MGRPEGTGKELHGHVTALTVGPQYRRIGVANKLMEMLEQVSKDM